MPLVISRRWRLWDGIRVCPCFFLAGLVAAHLPGRGRPAQHVVRRRPRHRAQRTADEREVGLVVDAPGEPMAGGLFVSVPLVISRRWRLWDGIRVPMFLVLVVRVDHSRRCRRFDAAGNIGLMLVLRRNLCMSVFVPTVNHCRGLSHHYEESTSLNVLFHILFALLYPQYLAVLELAN